MSEDVWRALYRRQLDAAKAEKAKADAQRTGDTDVSTEPLSDDALAVCAPDALLVRVPVEIWEFDNSSGLRMMAFADAPGPLLAAPPDLKLPSDLIEASPGEENVYRRMAALLMEQEAAYQEASCAEKKDVGRNSRPNPLPACIRAARQGNKDAWEALASDLQHYEAVQKAANGIGGEEFRDKPWLLGSLKATHDWFRSKRGSAVTPGRKGPKLRAEPPEFFRAPAAAPCAGVLTALFTPERWQPNEAGTAVYAQRNDTQVMLDCDDSIGFGPAQAIHQIAKYGASAAQTFLAMTTLWLRENKGKSHETYLTAYASDLLRAQGRKEMLRGGYKNEDIMAKGRDVWVLSRISVPMAQQITYKGGRTVKSVSVGALLMVQSLDAQQTQQTREPGDVKSVVRFRYHLGADVYEWLCGDKPQYAAISGKLLAYHPERQKYHILLGFCLAYYDRVNRKSQAQTRRISLPSLLELAGIPVPARNIPRFTEQIQTALEELAEDGVIPGVTFQLSSDPSKSARALLAGAKVEFPRMIAAADGADGTEPAA